MEAARLKYLAVIGSMLVAAEWVSFAMYTHSAAGISGGVDLLPGMNYGPNHFLVPESRDFFAVFSRG